MAGGLAVFAAASAAFVAGGDPHLLGAARFVQGAAAAAFSPAASAAVAAFGGKKRTGRLFGGYGGAKGAGYLLGPVAGGALVAAGGYPLLFGVLAAVALIAAAAVAALVPRVAVGARQRSGVADLARHLSGADFLRPVLLLAAATAALSAGVGFLPVLGARDQLGPLATGALVSLLAAVAAVLQPWAGRRLDAGRLGPLGTTERSLAVVGRRVGRYRKPPFGSARRCAIRGPRDARQDRATMTSGSQGECERARAVRCRSRAWVFHAALGARTGGCAGLISRRPGRA
jgi:MFS family permease